MFTCYKVLPLLLLLAVATTHVAAQRYSSNYGNRNYRSRVYTPYFANQGYGYNSSAYRGGYGRSSFSSPYQFSPYLNYQLQEREIKLPPVTGPVERYSEVEYGQIVEMAIEAARRNRPTAPSTGPRPSIVEMTTGTEAGQAAYTPVSTEVSDILDRGVFLLPTGEELRLRGVSTPSSTDTNNVARLYAKEAIQTLRNLVQGKEVYIVLDEPVRDGSGRILGTVFLEDGTDLNKYMLEKGYGMLKTEDFAPGVDYSDLSTAQQAARDARVGVWSGGY